MAAIGRRLRLVRKAPPGVKDGGYLLFSDIPRNSVMKWKEGEGVSLFMKPSGYTGVVDYMPQSGQQWPHCSNPQGRAGVFASTAIAAFRGWRRMAARKRWSTTIKASGSTANDAVYKSNGDLYFTDCLRPAEELRRSCAASSIFADVSWLSKSGEFDATASSGRVLTASPFAMISIACGPVRSGRGNWDGV